jgi:hypothetical protein
MYLNVVICTKCSSEIELPMQTLHQSSVRSKSFNTVANEGRWMTQCCWEAKLTVARLFRIYIHNTRAETLYRSVHSTHMGPYRRKHVGMRTIWFIHTGRVWCALPGYSPREHPAPGKNANIINLFIGTLFIQEKYVAIFAKKSLRTGRKFAKKELRNLFLQNILKRDGQFCQNNPENGKKSNSEHFLLKNISRRPYFSCALPIF